MNPNNWRPTGYGDLAQIFFQYFVAAHLETQMVEKRISHCWISSYLYTLHLSDFFSYPSIGTSVLTAPPFTHITDVAAPSISRHTDSTASDKSIACVGAAPTFLFLRAAV